MLPALFLVPHLTCHSLTLSFYPSPIHSPIHLIFKEQAPASLCRSKVEKSVHKSQHICIYLWIGPRSTQSVSERRTEPGQPIAALLTSLMLSIDRSIDYMCRFLFHAQLCIQRQQSHVDSQKVSANKTN